MLIHGYTEDKLIARIDLPLEAVLDKQIDPFQLDLFDPDPVAHKIGSQWVFFSKIKDVAFAYTESHRLFLCTHDGVSPICLWSDYSHTNPSYVETRNVKMSDRDFSHHLSRYLTGHRDPEVIAKKRGFQTYLLDPKSTTLIGETLYLKCRTRYGEDWGRNVDSTTTPVLFRGEMFRGVPIAVNTPKEIDWVFETLAAFRPTVVFQAVWAALKGQPIAEVEVVFSQSDRQNAMEVLRKNPKVVFTGSSSCGSKQWQHYEFMGCKYYLTVNRFDQPISDYLNTADLETFSVHGVYCSKPGEVWGTRIALCDFARNLATPLSRQSQVWVRKQLEEVQPLRVWFPTTGGRPCAPNEEKTQEYADKSFTVLAPLEMSGLVDRNETSRPQTVAPERDHEVSQPASRTVRTIDTNRALAV